MATSMKVIDQSNGPTMSRATLLPALDSKVDWARQSLLMNAFLKRKTGAEQMLKMKLIEGTPAQVLSFKREHQRLNDYVYSYIVEMCVENETAFNQILNCFNTDPDCWANSLWSALEHRFTREKQTQLQTSLMVLNKFKYEPPESFKDSVDRFKFFVSRVRAVDMKQIPADITLMATVKESFLPFPHLWSTLKSRKRSI